MSGPAKDYRDAASIPQEVALRPIGVVRSPFTERFNTPRQGSLQSDPTQSRVVFDKRLVQPEALADLAGFDRVWLLTYLHLNRSTLKPRVTPPRGGPPRSIYATRAPHRVNPIGLSAVRLIGVEGLTLYVAEVDLIDGTPVLDVKPYVPYADAFPDARAGWVDAQGGRPLPEPAPSTGD